MKKILLPLLLFAALAATAAPGTSQKIATANLEKIFNDFYKTAQVEGIIKQQAQIYQDYLNKQMEKMREQDKTFRIELDKAQNIALSAQERENAAKEADRLNNSLRALRAEMEAYSTDKRQQMAELSRNKRLELMAEITAVIQKLAIDRGFDFVFDTSGRSANDAPTVLYSTPSVDLSAEAINLLNKGNMPQKGK